MAKKVLLLSGKGATSRQILYCLKRADMNIHAIGSQRSILFHSRQIEKFHIAPLSAASIDRDAFAAKINTLNDIERFDFIIPGAGTDILCAANDKINIVPFPVPSVESYCVLNDKWQFYRLCQDNRVPVPGTKFFNDKYALRESLQEKKKRIVVKPTTEGYSAGIVFANGKAGLAKPIFDNSAYQFKPLIAQEFIEGTDIDLSVLAWKGEIQKAAIQIRINKDIIFVENSEILEFAQKLIRVTNYCGVAHFDARISAADGTLYFLECNPRFWGTIHAALFCGLNFVAEGLRVAEGRSISESAIAPGASYVSPLNAIYHVACFDFRCFDKLSNTANGLFQVLSDPIPHFYANFQSLLRRLPNRTKYFPNT